LIGLPRRKSVTRVKELLQRILKPFSQSKPITDYLAPELRAPEHQTCSEFNEICAQHLNTQSARLWAEIPDGHKWLGYFEIYETLFAAHRNKAPRIFEIGVYLGASLKLWKAYFGPQSTIVGLDIDPDCAKYHAPEQGVHVEIGDQSDPNFLRIITVKYGPLDIIIDDGSHIVSHQIASFNALIDKGLAADGIYMVEDIESSYWGHVTGQRDTEIGFMDFAKMVVDQIHSVYEEATYPDFALETVPGQQVIRPKIVTLISKVQLTDSIASFHRGRALPPVVDNLLWRRRRKLRELSLGPPLDS